MIGESAPLRSFAEGRFRQSATILGLLLATATCLALGLSLPVMQVEKFSFWESDYSIVTGVIGLLSDGEYLLAAIIFFFSVLFPVVKLVVLWRVWQNPRTHARRLRLLRALSKLGRWSMLDVLAVAILVVAGMLRAVADLEPRVGIYAFAIGVVLSMLATAWIQRSSIRAARKSLPTRDTALVDDLAERDFA